MAVLLIILMWLVTCQAEFKDEMQFFDPECLVEGAFFCLGGGCISQDKYCDGNRDCEDGSDENFCINHTPDALYCNETHQFLCGDGHKCVPSSWVCNNETDCNDGSDEVNCTVPIEHENSTCKGFLCDGGKRCISQYWTCDGHYDCDDKTDEDFTRNCRHIYHSNFLSDIVPCDKYEKSPCSDNSYCLTLDHMCDGLEDCRDGSDEGKFCSHWQNQCTNFTCPKNTKCKPRRMGPTCMCLGSAIFNDTSKQCDLINECEHLRPACSQKCHNGAGYFTCSCEEGYSMDRISQYLCFAPDPEALLFFSTKNDIRYVKVKSKEEVIVATGIKQAHGVSYDGNYLYWVETAQGHQAIMRAQLHNMVESKQVLAAFGIEDPGDIAVDFLGDNIYFSDTARGIISVCRSDGSLCTTLPANTKNPRFVTLEPKQGLMYWADWHDKAVIMSARMDGSQSDILVGNLSSFATGLALDSLNGRLYFVDQTVKVVRLKDKVVYFLFQEPFHHPYSLAVFENTVYWSDWTTNTILTADKLHGTSFNRNVLLRLDMPVFDMHLYHPILMKNTQNPCNHNLCAICLVTSNTTHVCACPDTMEMIGNRCQVRAGERPQFVLVGAGSHVTRVRRDVIGNPELHDTHLDVGRLQALAYDSYRDTLYIYDSQQKSINYMNLSDFTLGITHVLVNKGLENVVDMDYDFVSDTLYILDAGRHLIEVVSLSTRHSAIIYYFTHEEVPMSLCLLPDYGKLLVAVLESDENNEIHIDSITLDGEDRQHVLLNNIIGPNIRIRYSPDLNLVYMSDEGRGVIDVMHPEGKGREVFREVLTTIGSVASTSTHLFWTDRHSSRLYWADVHEATHRIRRIELSIFPNDTNLHVLATSLPPRGALAAHACFAGGAPCSHVCVQTRNGNTSGHRCVCSPGFKMVNGDCLEIIHCRSDELYCHRSNQCFLKTAKCDGVKDCKYGEDEEGCAAPVTQSPLFCKHDQTNCHGVCISKNDVCKGNTIVVPCAQWEWPCTSGALCVSRTLACDGRADCPDGSDESPAACDTGTCFRTEFMCGSGNCIPITWHCDGGEDCADGSDEINCESNEYLCPEHLFQCKNNTCIDLSKRCDGKYDCEDHDDEDDCDISELFEESENLLTCMPWEYACEHNSSICLPMTARCNGKVDCPGGTDETGCYLHCLLYREIHYSCKQELMCLSHRRWCDGHTDCGDGSDETAEACAMMNKTLPVDSSHQVESCSKGYRCDSGQCVEWTRVCDRVRDCADGSDEERLCESPCTRDTCEHSCQPSPRGPHCTCPHGYTVNGSKCHDVDECALSTCSQVCHNLPGSFVCSCHAGYALRSDRRSCKAVRGRLSVLYTKRSSVWSMTNHIHSLQYHDKDDKEISDIDIAVMSGKMYVASSQMGKLVEVNLHDKGSEFGVITNVGVPTKVSADWVTGNVYFSDGHGHVRVCHFRRRRCAHVLQLPSVAKVTALVVDPANYKMFFCVSEGTEAIVRSASLSGKNVSDLTSVASCSGLAADSFSKIVYIASDPSSIMQVDYDGKVMMTIFSNNPTIHSPQHLALFEDHLYLLSGTHLIRCLLFSSKTCSPYSHLPNGTAFVIQHESVQRDDVHDDCETITCSNICVMESMGPQCVCHDGTWTSDGTCPPVEDSELARFEGVVVGMSSTRALPVVVVTLVVVLFALYVCLFVRRLTKKKNAANYMQVRYQNTTDGMTHLSNPILNMPEAGYIINGMGHEFVNPLQFVRNMWQESFHKKSKPIGTSGLSFDTHQDLSDTESDLDVRESRRMIKE